MELRYISFEDAKYIHKKTIEHSGGGTIAVIDLGRLDSILEHIKNDDYYPTIVDKLTHLFFGVCEFHCFSDGNKRLAITLSTQFLLINGYMSIARLFFTEMENISYHVAAGKIEETLLHDIMDAFMRGTYSEDEGLKLRLLNAISDNT